MEMFSQVKEKLCLNAAYKVVELDDGCKTQDRNIRALGLHPEWFGLLTKNNIAVKIRKDPVLKA